MKVSRAVVFTLIILFCLSAPFSLASPLQDSLIEIYTTPIRLESEPIVGWLALIGTAFTIDQDVRDYTFAQHTPARDSFFNSITYLGHPVVDLVIVGGLALFGEDEVAYKSANAVVYSGILTQAIKLVVGRPRPYVENQSVKPFSWDDDYWSFPSGHTASAFALARVLAEEYPDYKGLFYGGALLVGLSRIYLDKHHASDVVAGAAIGLFASRHVEANTCLFEVKF